MRIVLSGGIGNRLFQWSYGYYVEEKIGVKVQYIDSNIWILNLYRRLLKVGSHGNDIRLLERHFKASRKITLVELGILMLSRLLRKPISGVWWTDEEPTERFLNKTIIRSYFQYKCPITESFVENIREELNIPSKCEDVIAIHFRAPDLAEGSRNLAGYYKRALEDVMTKYDYPIVIVTNNRKLAKHIFEPAIAGVRNMCIQSGNALQDLRILSSARVLVSTNSTFSWWAAEISKEVEYILSPPITDFGQPFNPRSLKKRHYTE